jgi:hypothetical protein
MKKPLTATSVKKKNKTGEKQKAKNPSLKSISLSGEKQDQLKGLVQQLKTELFDKIDQKFNGLNHRFDRIEDGIDEVLDELRATEALLESETEPYEGQA